MKFNLGSKREGTDWNLTSLSGKDSLKIESVKFTSTSIKKLAEIMQNGEPSASNQKLEVTQIELLKEEYEKLTDKKYSAEFFAAVDVGGDLIMKYKFHMSCFSIEYNMNLVNYYDDYVKIENAEIMTYAYKRYSYEEC